MSLSLLEQQFAERERTLIEQAAFGKGKASLPEGWDEQREKRLAKVTEDFIAFATTYFPQWFDYPFTRQHRKMIADALRIDRKLAVYAAPRSFGKTRLFRVFKAFCACTGAKHFYGKVSDTIDLVLKDYRHTRYILKYNPKIVSDFGTLISDDWDSMQSFYVAPHKHNPQGTLFAAYSTTVTARGELAETRLDMIEFDDFEDFSTSVNPDISKNKLEIIERDFMPALADAGSAVLLGNNARTTCLINILTQMSDTDRAALHPAIELNIVDAWDDKRNRATWHERYPEKSEEEMRKSLNVSISVWKAEFRQQPTPPEGSRFLLQHFSTYDPESVKGPLRGVIMCDPAYGTKSDFKSVAVMLYSFKRRKFLVPEAFCRRCGWETYFLAMYDIFARWKHCIPDIIWEQNFGQAQFLEFQKLYASVKDRPPLPIRFKTVEGEKFFRISRLEAPYSLGNILFSNRFLETPDGVEAQSQLIGYEGKKDAAHRVDFPDALSSAYDELYHLMMQSSPDSFPQSLMAGERRSNERY